MVSIKMKPSDVWSFMVSRTGAERDAEYEIASNDDYDLSITAFVSDNDIAISVWMDGNLCDYLTVDDELDCEDVVSALFDEYLTSKVFDTVSGLGDEPYTGTMEDLVKDRESELFDATMEFILLALDADYKGKTDIDEICERTQEAFLGFLGTRLGLPVYRPTIKKDKTGKEVLCDYPYQDDKDD